MLVRTYWTQVSGKKIKEANSVRKVDFFIREFSYLGKEELLVTYFYSKSVFLILYIVLEVRYSEKHSKKRKYNSSNTYALKLLQRGLATGTKNVHDISMHLPSQ